MPRKIVRTLVTRPAKNKGAKPAKTLKDKRTRRVFTEEFRREAVAMLLDGHAANSPAPTAPPPSSPHAHPRALRPPRAETPP